MQNNEIKNEEQLDCNLNINQQIFINENKSEQNKESNKKQKNINSNEFHLFPDDDDD